MVIKKERPIVMLDWLLRIEVSVYILYQGFIWKFFVWGGGGGTCAKHGKVQHNLISTFVISHLNDTLGNQ